MKSMTCRQMGGPCNAVIVGNTAKEMMDNGSKHIKEYMGDAEHKKVFDMMMDMQKDPAAGKKWNEEFEMRFASLPEN